MMTATPASLRDAVAGLAAVLTDLATALARGQADDVLALESRLAPALDDVRGRLRQGERAEVADLVLEIHERVTQCRRLGATVPAMLSVMFPGQLTYGPPAARAAAALPTSSALTRVI